MIDDPTPDFVWRGRRRGFEYELNIRGGNPRLVYRRAFASETICGAGSVPSSRET